LQRLFDLYKLEGVSIPIVPKPDAIWAFPDPSHVPHYQLTAAVQSDTEETEQIGQPISSFLREVLKERVGRMANHRIGYFPGSQPVSLGRGNLQRLRENPTYRATYKSDGTRYLLLSHDGGNYLIDRKFAIYKVNVLLVNRRGQPLRRSLFDGELVNESRRSGRKCYTFLIFDILEFEEFNLINNDWDTRMDYVSKGVVAFREMLAQRDPQLFEHEDFGVACKRQWKLNQLGQLESFIDSEVKHDTDGIIFTPLSMLYIKGTCEEILKWKPITLNSVDFIGKWHNGVLYLAVRMFHPKDESEDIPVSVLDGEFNMQYLESLDKAVIECAFDVASGAWKPMRTRSDKTTPNAYEVFVSVYDSIKDNITVQSLQEEFGVEDGPGW
jgi:mRNA-capping enzyme